jgi:hypothetical protein
MEAVFGYNEAITLPTATYLHPSVHCLMQQPLKDRTVSKLFCLLMVHAGVMENL